MRGVAFTLIELMVTIAIIAVLAAIALPAYSTYISKAKINSVFHMLDEFANMEMQYYSQHGSFANATQLGIGTGTANVNNSSTYNPNVSQFYLNHYAACPKPTSEVSAKIDSNVVNYNGPPDSLFFEILIVDEGNGVLTKNCYWRDDAGTTQEYVKAYLPPNCQNQAPSNGCT